MLDRSCLVRSPKQTCAFTTYGSNFFGVRIRQLYLFFFQTTGDDFLASVISSPIFLKPLVMIFTDGSYDGLLIKRFSSSIRIVNCYELTVKNHHK